MPADLRNKIGQFFGEENRPMPLRKSLAGYGAIAAHRAGISTISGPTY